MRIFDLELHKNSQIAFTIQISPSLLMKLPILFVILYIFLLIFRLQQPAFEPKFDILKNQRNFLGARIQSFLSSPESDLTSGILLGQNKNLPAGLRLALRDTSTLHIVVASGQNLSMVGGFFLALAGLIKKKNAVLLSLLAVGFYTVLSGFQVPILRAAVMFGLASIGQLVGRERDGWRILSLTGALMLLVNPKWISEISFQLSFLSTFGVIVIAPIFLRWLGRVPIIGQDLAVSLAAQIMVTPVIAQNFHQFSFVGLVTNVFVLWTVAPIMILASMMLVLGSLLTWPLLALTQYFVYIVTFFGHLPFAWRYIGDLPWIVWVGYYMVVTAIMLSLMYVEKETS